MPSKPLAVLSLVLALMPAMPVAGQTPPADTRDPASWQRRLAELESEVAQLRRQQQDEQGPDRVHSVAHELGGEWGGDALANGYPNARLTALMQIDMGWISQDSRHRAELEDLDNGWNFRRARIGVSGEVADNVAYHAEFDFAQRQARFIDVFMDLRHAVGVGHHVRIGRFRQPFGMTELTGIRETGLLERPSPFALSPFRNTGIMLHGNNGAEPTRTYAVSAFQYESDNYGNVYAGHSSWGLATRWTWLVSPAHDDQNLVHLGLDYSVAFPGRQALQLASLPEFVLGQNPLIGLGAFDTLPIEGVPPFVQTDVMPTSHVHFANVEAAGRWGALAWQTEARQAWVERTDGRSHTFPAAYATLRYVLTGETLPYKRSAAVFGRVVPDRPVTGYCGPGGPGAWELVGRVSWIDLNETGLPGPGREMTNLTAGLNWYWNRYTRFQFNYIWSGLESSVDGPLAGTRSQAHLYALRGQVDF